jgi:hypothetical protein
MVDLMNTDIGKMLNRSRTISNEMIWRKIFSDSSFREMILDWVRLDQLTKRGVDEDGDIIGFYSEFTELINPQKVAGTPFTLNDSGDFYESMFIVVLSDSFIIDADPIKVDENGEITDLFKKYGDGIVGLNDESRSKLADELRKRYIEETRNVLFVD